MKNVIRAISLMLCMVMMFSVTVFAKTSDAPPELIEEMLQSEDLYKFGTSDPDNLMLISYYGEIGGYHIGVFFPKDRAVSTWVGKLIIGNYEFTFSCDAYKENLFAYKDGEFILHSKQDFAQLLSEDELKQLAEAAGATLIGSATDEPEFITLKHYVEYLKEIDPVLYEDLQWSEVKISERYGMYNGGEILFMSVGEFGSDDIDLLEIGGYTFVIPNGSTSIHFCYYKDGKFESVLSAYEAGKLTNDDLRAVAKQMPGSYIGNIDEILTDVAEKLWAKPAITYVYDNEIMLGTARGKFSPDMTLSRAQFVQILFNMSGENADDYMGESEFADVEADSWYTAAVNWASEKGVTAGIGGGVFGVKENVSRQQLVKFLYNYFAPEALDADLSEYTDAEDVSDWALEAMEWAVGAGVVSSTSESSLVLAPKNPVMRAGTAAMLYNYLNN